MSGTQERHTILDTVVSLHVTGFSKHSTPGTADCRNSKPLHRRFIGRRIFPWREKRRASYPCRSIYRSQAMLVSQFFAPLRAVSSPASSRALDLAVRKIAACASAPKFLHRGVEA